MGDSLGMLAQNGHSGYCRHTLIGGNYGLLDTLTLEPNPDFYSTLLWQKVMGKRVLKVDKRRPSSPNLRAYAHCTRGASDGSVSLLLINLDRDQAIKTTYNFSVASREEYHFTSN